MTVQKFVIPQNETLFDLPPTYQSAWADIDNDGDLDLCHGLFLNATERGHWIEFDLIGNGEKVSRTPFGAVRIEPEIEL